MIRKAIANKMKVGMDFGWLLDGFLVDCWAKLEVKLGPSRHRNRRKWGTKAMSKKGMQKVHASHAGQGGGGP